MRWFDAKCASTVKEADRILELFGNPSPVL